MNAPLLSNAKDHSESVEQVPCLYTTLYVKFSSLLSHLLHALPQHKLHHALAALLIAMRAHDLDAAASYILPSVMLIPSYWRQIRISTWSFPPEATKVPSGLQSSVSNSSTAGGASRLQQVQSTIYGDRYENLSLIKHLNMMPPFSSCSRTILLVLLGLLTHA